MQDFIDNLGRYFRFFITFSLGIFFALFERIRPLFRNRIAAIALVGIFVSGFAFIFFTLRAMLGLATI